MYVRHFLQLCLVQRKPPEAPGLCEGERTQRSCIWEMRPLSNLTRCVGPHLTPNPREWGRRGRSRSQDLGSSGARPSRIGGGGGSSLTVLLLRISVCGCLFLPVFAPSSLSFCDSPSLPLLALNLSLWGLSTSRLFKFCLPTSPPLLTLSLLLCACLPVCVAPPVCVCSHVFLFASLHFSLALGSPLPSPVGQCRARTPSPPLPLSIPPGALPPPPSQFPSPRLSLQP